MVVRLSSLNMTRTMNIMSVEPGEHVKSIFVALHMGEKVPAFTCCVTVTCFITFSNVLSSSVTLQLISYAAIPFISQVNAAGLPQGWIKVSHRDTSSGVQNFDNQKKK